MIYIQNSINIFMNIELIKSWIQVGMVVVFGLSIIVGFFMGLIPLEVFTGIASGVIAYMFKDIQSSRQLEATVLALKSNEATVVDEKEI